MDRGKKLAGASLILLFSVFASGCTHFSMDKYVSQDYDRFRQGTRLSKLGVMPLLVVAPTATSTNLFEIGRQVWLHRETMGVVMTEGEVKPAEAKVLAGLKQTVPAITIVPPDDVLARVRNFEARTEEDLFRLVAEKTGAEATLAFVVRGFNSTQGGYGRESEGSGLVTVVCYNAQGRVLWTLSTSYGYKISGFSAAPTLSEYMEHYMRQMDEPLREMFGGMR